MEKDQNYQGALDAYNQAIELSPNPTYLFKKGLALYSLRRREEALETLEKVQALPDRYDQNRLDNLKNQLRQQLKRRDQSGDRN